MLQYLIPGLLQLLQNFRMFSWALPESWQIVCTANPEGGDYSVTPMDDAMLTRMLHLTMVFDVKVWAKWAEAADVDPRPVVLFLGPILLQAPLEKPTPRLVAGTACIIGGAVLVALFGRTIG